MTLVLVKPVGDNASFNEYYFFSHIRDKLFECLRILPGAYVRSLEGCSCRDYRGDGRDQPPDCRPHSGWSIQLWTSWPNRYRRPIALSSASRLISRRFARHGRVRSASEKQDGQPVYGSESKICYVSVCRNVAVHLANYERLQNVREYLAYVFDTRLFARSCSVETLRCFTCNVAFNLLSRKSLSRLYMLVLYTLHRLMNHSEATCRSVSTCGTRFNVK